MEMSIEQKKATPKVERKKGGFRTLPFIIGDDDPFLYHGFFLFRTVV